MLLFINGSKMVLSSVLFLGISVFALFPLGLFLALGMLRHLAQENKQEKCSEFIKIF